jgi:hypothetical protein
VEEHLKAADAKCDEAAAYKPSFIDTHLTRSSLEQLRAKVAANYLAAPVK